MIAYQRVSEHKCASLFYGVGIYSDSTLDAFLGTT